MKDLSDEVGLKESFMGKLELVNVGTWKEWNGNG